MFNRLLPLLYLKISMYASLYWRKTHGMLWIYNEWKNTTSVTFTAASWHRCVTFSPQTTSWLTERNEFEKDELAAQVGLLHWLTVRSARSGSVTRREFVGNPMFRHRFPDFCILHSDHHNCYFHVILILKLTASTGQGVQEWRRLRLSLYLHTATFLFAPWGWKLNSCSWGINNIARD